MKRAQLTKRNSRVTLRSLDLKKPFGFCCDINYQDPETKYDMRNPPFGSVFPDTEFDHSRPEVKFCVQDIAKAPPAALRTAIFRQDVEIKQAATYGRSKKGRGPLKWFLEEEIEAARNLIAKEKELEYKEKKKKLQNKIKSHSKRKNKKHQSDINSLVNTKEIKSCNTEESNDEATDN